MLIEKDVVLNPKKSNQGALAVHLIIQGPIISWSPKSKSEVQFNSNQNILKIIDRFGDKFKSIHIVTWFSEVTEELENGLARFSGKNVILKKIDDPGRGEDIFGPLPDNRMRQYFSSLEGLSSVGRFSSSDDACLKIRTDQYLDLDLLAAELVSILSFDPEKIVFPFALPCDLYSVGDFYMGGRLGSMIEFFNYLIATIQYPAGSRSVHSDIAQKYLRFRGAMAKFRFTLTGRDAWRKGLVPIDENELNLWAGFIHNYFGLFSRRVSKTVLWRGSSLGARDKYIFGEDAADLEKVSNILFGNSVRRLSRESFLTRFVFKDCDSISGSPIRLYFFKLNYYVRKIILGM